MGWAHGHIDGKPVGYGVAATCEEDGCEARINRGLAYRCSSSPTDGCGGYFCESHLHATSGRSAGLWCRRCSSTHEQAIDDLSSTELLARALRHVYGCPTEPFVCDDPDHELATELVTEMDARV